MLVGCGDPPGGTATGAMSGAGLSGEGTDASTGDGVTGGIGGSATSGATTGASETSATESGSGSGASGTGASGTSGGADTSGGSTGEPPPDIAEECSSGELAAQQVDMYRCSCQVQDGLYPDMEACLAKQGEEQFANGCSCEVFADHPEDLEFMTCYSDAVKNLAKCLAKMDCSEKSGQDLCVDIYFGAIEDCPQPAKETLGQLAIQCGGEVPIMCGSGETIPAAWQCDGEADCADESDEYDCFFNCGDGQVVNKHDQCDGEYDCFNGADEKGCGP